MNFLKVAPPVVALIAAAALVDWACAPPEIQPDPPASSAPAFDFSRECERDLNQALARYAVARDAGVDPVLALGEGESGLDGQQQETLRMVINDFDLARADPVLQDQGLAAQIGFVSPVIEERCSIYS